MIVALSGYSAYFDASMNAPQDEMVVAGDLSFPPSECNSNIRTARWETHTTQ